MGPRQIASASSRAHTGPAAGALVLALLAMIVMAATGRAVLSSGLEVEAAEASVDTDAGATLSPRSPSPPLGGDSAAGAHRAQRGSAEQGEELAQVRNAAGEPLREIGGACERNLLRAAAQGLRLPDGWKMHCVGPGLDWEGGTHWGVTCPYEECPEGEGPYVSISKPTYYVVAHELCHANFGNDELMADACAAKHGASLASSPYS